PKSVEALPEPPERRPPTTRPPDHVPQLAAERVALLLDVTQPPLEILDGFGPADHEIPRARVDQVDGGRDADDEAEQQHEEKPHHDHAVSSAKRPLSRTTTWSAASVVRGAVRRSRIASCTARSGRSGSVPVARRHDPVSRRRAAPRSAPSPST